MAEVTAHITGTVWKVLVSEGDLVEAEQEVVILESMKMEMPVVAPSGGKVAEVKVAPGESVEEGDVLIVVE